MLEQYQLVELAFIATYSYCLNNLAVEGISKSQS